MHKYSRSCVNFHCIQTILCIRTKWLMVSFGDNGRDCIIQFFLCLICRLVAISITRSFLCCCIFHLGTRKKKSSLRHPIEIDIKMLVSSFLLNSINENGNISFYSISMTLVKFSFANLNKYWKHFSKPCLVKTLWNIVKQLMMPLILW